MPPAAKKEPAPYGVPLPEDMGIAGLDVSGTTTVYGADDLALYLGMRRATLRSATHRADPDTEGKAPYWFRSPIGPKEGYGGAYLWTRQAAIEMRTELIQKPLRPGPTAKRGDNQ